MSTVEIHLRQGRTGSGYSYSARDKSARKAIVDAAAGLLREVEEDGFDLFRQTAENERLNEWLTEAQHEQIRAERRARMLAESLQEVLDDPNRTGLPVPVENRARENLRLYREGK